MGHTAGSSLPGGATRGTSPRRPAALLALVLLGLAVAAWGQPPASWTFHDVAAMCRVGALAPGGKITLEGYRAPGDGGGGLFRWDPDSAAEPDGGSVFKPEKLRGRLLRVVAPDEDAYAEWFGAYGDGDGSAPHDDHAAISACLAAYGRVQLRAKTYGLRGKPAPHNPQHSYSSVDLGPNYRIVGAGRDRTTLKLLDKTNPPGGGAGDNYFCLLANRDFYESADYVVIRDLAIDCNFDGQDLRTTIHAIAIRGGGALVERLNVRGYGTGRHPDNGASRECFAVYQTLVYKDRQGCRRAALYRDLDLTGCGHNGKVEGGVGEITHLALGGADNFENKSWILRGGKDPAFDPANEGENENNWWPSYGGGVENCVIHDEVYEPGVQNSPLNGITYSDCVGMSIRGNRVENWEGTAVFVMSWWNRDTTLTDNHFLGVTTGLALCLMAQDGKPSQCPRHENVLFTGNEIVTGSDKHAPWGMQALSLYGQDLPAGVRMRGIHIIGNRVSGRAYTSAAGARSAPLGLKVQILRQNYEDLRFEDNVIDLPDYTPADWVPQEPHALSMMYFPLAYWAEAIKTGKVVYRNNRTPDGKLLYPLLVDWYFKNKPQYGR